ncbi:MAG: 50S ribosomal protein L32 [Myxococcota bacterium]
MAVPKRRTSRSKTKKRRAHHDKVFAPNLIPCPSCGDVMVAHRVCPSCGHYKGRQVITPKSVTDEFDMASNGPTTPKGTTAQ